MAQRLVRLICPAVLKTEVCPPRTWHSSRVTWRERGPRQAVGGRGCRHCQGTGYRGRQGVFEMDAG